MCSCQQSVKPLSGRNMETEDVPSVALASSSWNNDSETSNEKSHDISFLLDSSKVSSGKNAVFRSVVVKDGVVFSLEDEDPWAANHGCGFPASIANQPIKSIIAKSCLQDFKSLMSMLEKQTIKYVEARVKTLSAVDRKTQIDTKMCITAFQSLIDDNETAQLLSIQLEPHKDTSNSGSFTDRSGAATDVVSVGGHTVQDLESNTSGGFQDARFGSTGVFIVDIETEKILWVNQNFLKVVGYDKKPNRLPRFWRDMIPPEYQMIERTLLSKALVSGSYGPIRREIVSSTGSRVTVSHSGIKVIHKGRNILWNMIVPASSTLATMSTFESNRANHQLKLLTDWVNLYPEISLDEILESAARELGMTFGIICNIDTESNKYVIRHVTAPPNTMVAGQEFDLGATYCEVTLKGGRPLSIPNAGASMYAKHPCYEAFHLESYIGAPIVIEGKPYGTVNFSSPDPIEGSFSESDEHFVQMLADFVGHTIGQDIRRKEIDNLLYAAIPEAIADELRSTKSKTLSREHDNVCVLFADLQGFTAMCDRLQKEPDRVLKVLSHVFGELDKLCDTHQVVKVKTIGDSYMCMSGAPESLSPREAARRVVNFGIDVVEVVRRLCESSEDLQGLAVRVGIGLGPVIAGVLSPNRPLYDIWGHTVNLSSRLESTGEPNYVVVSEMVCKATKGLYEFQERSPLEMKGLGSVTSYRVVEKHPSASIGELDSLDEAGEARCFVGKGRNRQSCAIM